MASASLNYMMSLTSNLKYDPADIEVRQERGFLMMAYFVGSCDSALGSLVTIHNRLKRYSTAKVAALFPEKEFNALTYIEFVLNYVKFTIDDPKEFMSDLSETMEYWNSTIAALTELLRASSLLDEEQALRVEACYKDIANAVQRCKQLVENGGNSDATGAEDSERWQPFFKSHFSTEKEKIFMTRLRKIYTSSHILPAGDTFQGLQSLCHTTDLRQVLSSDVQTHTAMRVILSIVYNAVTPQNPMDLTLARFNYLLKSFYKLNNLPFLQSSANSSACLEGIAVKRIVSITGLMERAYLTAHGERRAAPFFVDCTTLCPPSAVLWQKLTAPESAISFADPAIFTDCAICQKNDVANTNFAILDECSHLYCATCAFLWFQSYRHSNCPYCRTEVQEWTTRDCFLSFITKHSSSDDVTENNAPL